MRKVRSTLGTRLLGLVFIVILISLLALSVGAYHKVFTPATWVTVSAERTGLQFSEGADVRLRGVIVGDVREIRSDGSGARLRIALDPDYTREIPANVQARLLPKSIFGEKYVDLVVPAGAADRPIRAGDVIEQDRSQATVELEKVLDQLLVLLQAVKPEKLQATLTALANAVEGRGDRIGRDLVALRDYLAALNREMPTIQADLTKLADVLNLYADVTPDLLEILRNFTVTANTITEQKANLQAFLITTTDMATETRIFLDRYDDRLIVFTRVTAPLTEILEVFSDEYPCLFAGIVKLLPRANQTFAGGRLNITLEITRDQGKFVRNQDEPEWERRPEHVGNCRGLPNPPVPFPHTEVEGTGYCWRCHDTQPVLPIGLPGLPVVQQSNGSGTRNMVYDPTMGYAGTQEERAVIKSVLAASQGTSAEAVPDLAVLLWGPLMRGAEVSAT